MGLKVSNFCKLQLFWCILVTVISTNTESYATSYASRQLCNPGDPIPPNRVNTTEQLEKIRQWMNSNGINIYIQLNKNRFLSSPESNEKFVTWISGFSGSNGNLLIMRNDAILFTDNRYTLQADQELECNWKIVVSTTIPLWIKANVPVRNLAVLAVDVQQIEIQLYNQLMQLKNIKMQPITNGNPINDLWTENRPPVETRNIYPLNMTFTGKTWQSKVNETVTYLNKENIDYLTITKLDETAYMMNLRATVISYNPFFPSIAIIAKNIKHIYFFFENKTEIFQNKELRDHFNIQSNGECRESGNKVEYNLCAQIKNIREYNTTVSKLSSSSKNVTVWVDQSATSYYVYSIWTNIFPNVKFHNADTFIKIAKTKKNAAEQVAYTECSMYDSAALIAFLAHLEEDMKKSAHYTELSASELLKQYRSKEPNYRGLSFQTIAGVGANAAVIHYRPTKTTDRKISNNEVFLLDSGGQYLGCTTDVTRTMYYGNKPAAEIQNSYTRVLMGVIDLFTLVWPKSLTSRNMDAFARANLWRKGKNYLHGTGHGIGMFLSVHEGPNGIGRDTILDIGNFQSIEPGYYQLASDASNISYGIRLETITGVQLSPVSTKTTIYHSFIPVTLVPFERKLINKTLLDQRQVDWLNWYHKKCRDEVGPYLKNRKSDTNAYQRAYMWLQKNTEAITINEDSGKKADIVRNNLLIYVTTAITVLVLVKATSS